VAEPTIEVGIETTPDGRHLVFVIWEHDAGGCRHWLTPQGAADVAGALLESAITADKLDEESDAEEKARRVAWPPPRKAK
jgi:hypothetical protein